MSKAMRPLWSQEPCENCGIEGYATRTEPRPMSDRYLCPECETWERAAAEFDGERKEMESAIRMMRKLLQRMVRCDEATQKAWSKQIKTVLTKTRRWARA